MTDFPSTPPAWEQWSTVSVPQGESETVGGARRPVGGGGNPGQRADPARGQAGRPTPEYKARERRRGVAVCRSRLPPLFSVPSLPACLAAPGFFSLLLGQTGERRGG
ncbi:hypothetical protein U9M48_032420 [Paspalum notatum var. saurae]|uniref:Uncharacterized protein n=1 Tax=Paspalum notatum var. saurae TaxID=547442 RepID=A0AAQ3X4G4_PASNO